MHTARPVPPMRQRLVRGARPVPTSVERLIVRGLTKKPGDRYATAEEFLSEVEYALRTPDGGVTDVVFDRPGDTGAQPLVTDDGEVRITGASDFLEETVSDSIADAISEALNEPPRAVPSPRELAREPLRNATPRGGIGLGLPYTGPDGQPIFGLTPEQRLAGKAAITTRELGVAAALEPDPRPATALPRLRRRLGVYAAIAALAVAIGVVAAVLTVRANRRTALDPNTPAGQASEALEHGNVPRALEILEKHKDRIESDPHAQLVLGHVRSARNESGLALAAYERALSLAPDLEADDKLRAELRAMASSTRDYAVVARAFDVWVGHTADPDARKRLLQAAVADEIARRKAVRPVLERRKLRDSVDWLKAYSLDLQDERSCEGRLEAVANLRALGDQRAVAALERAVVKGNRARNQCLLEAARAAIGYLKGLAPR
jgi:tetratricopeptide (TPR) repeat protein